MKPGFRCGMVLPGLLLAGPLAAQRLPPLPGDTVDLDHRFQGIEEATAVVLRSDGHAVRYHPGRATRRFPPASTFKIAHTVGALETGVADGPDFALPWDSTRVPRTEFFPDSWARDQTLRSAFQHSGDLRLPGNRSPRWT